MATTIVTRPRDAPAGALRERSEIERRAELVDPDFEKYLNGCAACPVLGDVNPAARADRFAELVARQSRFVFRVAWAVLRNAQDAEDVVQETFLKLCRSGGVGADGE